jgi:hypothetical protein
MVSFSLEGYEEKPAATAGIENTFYIENTYIENTYIENTPGRLQSRLKALLPRR